MRKTSKNRPPRGLLGRVFGRRAVRRLAVFILGVAVLVGLEAGVLYYVNNVYLTQGNHYTITRVTSSAVSAAKHRALTLPSGATGASVSSDGNYFAWLENGQIQIADMLSGGTTAVAPQKDRTIDSFKWVYGNDRLTILEKNTTEDRKKGYFDEIYGYDVDSKTTEVLTNYQNDNSVINISLNSSKETVADLDFSNETTVYYFKLTTPSSSSSSSSRSSSGSSRASSSSSSSSSSGSSSAAASGGRSRIWRLNNPDFNDAIDLPIRTIGHINSAKSDDYLLVEDSSTGHVYLYNGLKDNYNIYSVNGNKNLRLLDFDQEDNQYIGLVENGKVTSVVYGDAVKKQWQTLTLPTPADANDIHVAYSGAVFVDDPEAQTVTELTSSTSTAYTGSLLAVYDGGFYSVADGAVQDHPVKDAGVVSDSSSASDSSASSPASSAPSPASASSGTVSTRSTSSAKSTSSDKSSSSR